MLCLLWLHKRIGARPCARARTRSWRSAISSTTVLGEAYVQLTPCCHHWKATGIARSSRYKNEETLSHAARQRQVCGHRGRRLCSQNMVNPRDPRSARGGLSRGSDNGSHLLQQAVVVWECRRRGPNSLCHGRGKAQTSVPTQINVDSSADGTFLPSSRRACKLSPCEACSPGTWGRSSKEGKIHGSR